jgi:hypothetical protein
MIGSSLKKLLRKFDIKKEFFNTITFNIQSVRKVYVKKKNLMSIFEGRKWRERERERFYTQK